VAEPLLRTGDGLLFLRADGLVVDGRTGESARNGIEHRFQKSADRGDLRVRQVIEVYMCQLAFLLGVAIHGLIPFRCRNQDGTANSITLAFGPRSGNERRYLPLLKPSALSACAGSSAPCLGRRAAPETFQLVSFERAHDVFASADRAFLNGGLGGCLAQHAHLDGDRLPRQPFSRGENRHALHHVAQLARVAGPGVGSSTGKRYRPFSSRGSCCARRIPRENIPPAAGCRAGLAQEGTRWARPLRR